MSARDNAEESEMQPNTNSVHISPPLTAIDTRQQIITNALIMYPNIVQQHVNRFPNIPVRAVDIFDIHVIDFTRQLGSDNDRKYTARLTHAHEKYPAARMLLMGGSRAATIEDALHNLLEQSITGLGASSDKVPLREGCAQETTGSDAGWLVHKDSAFEGFNFAEKLRKLATDFDKAKK
jgi:hypothetical protein